MTKEDIKRIWLTDSAVWISAVDGRVASEKFDDFPRLRYATREQRENMQQGYFGLHWPDIDEDLSYEGFFSKKPSENVLYNTFVAHPEINASAIARRLGIAQSLLAQYISGTKKPSAERERAILNELRKVGEELQAIPI